MVFFDFWENQLGNTSKLNSKKDRFFTINRVRRVRSRELGLKTGGKDHLLGGFNPSKKTLVKEGPFPK